MVSAGDAFVNRTRSSGPSCEFGQLKERMTNVQARASGLRTLTFEGLGRQSAWNCSAHEQRRLMLRGRDPPADFRVINTAFPASVDDLSFCGVEAPSLPAIGPPVQDVHDLLEQIDGTARIRFCQSCRNVLSARRLSGRRGAVRLLQRSFSASQKLERSTTFVS